MRYFFVSFSYFFPPHDLDLELLLQLLAVLLVLLHLLLGLPHLLLEDVKDVAALHLSRHLEAERVRLGGWNHKGMELNQLSTGTVTDTTGRKNRGKRGL
jgi:hypothetical protein